MVLATKRRWAPGLSLTALAVCLMLLIGSLAGIPFALSSATLTTSSKDTDHLPEIEPDGIDADLMQQFPIIDEDGPLRTAFGRGIGPDDTAKVDSLIGDLMSQTGLDSMLPQWRAQAMSIRDMNWDSFRYDDNSNVLYPWRFRTVEDLLEQHLRPDAAPDSVQELAAAILIRYASEGGSPNELEAPVPNAMALAYTLLRMESEREPSCTAQLNLAFFVSQEAIWAWDAVVHETQRAIRLCGEDVRPLWLRGQTAAKHFDVRFSENGGYRGPEYVQFAEAAFEELRKQHPDSPLGWVGSADLRLTMADMRENIGGGSRPFQNRQWRSQALNYYRTARTKSAASQLSAGYSRALSANGQHSGAIALAEDLLALAPDWAPYQARLASALTEGREFSRLKDAIENFEPARDFSSVTMDMGDLAGTSSPSFRDFGVWLVPGGTGDSQVVNRSYLPVSTMTTPWFGCIQSQYDIAVTGSGEPAAQPASLDANAFAAMPTPAFISCPTGLQDARTDPLQDFHRWAGEFEMAETVVEDWITSQPDQALPRARAGEIAFLRGDMAKAEEHLTEASDRMMDGVEQYELPTYSGILGAEASDNGTADRGQRVAFYQQVLLQLGAVRSELGNADDAIETWSEAARIGAYDDGDRTRRGAIVAASEIGRERLSHGKVDDAYDVLSKAFSDSKESLWEDESVENDEVYSPELDGAMLNNLALAAGRAGHIDVAQEAAKWLERSDPDNPIYLDTLAYVDREAGALDAAADHYRSALARDATAYVSANNLAVLLARESREDEAMTLLESAVIAEPGYATAWHNLGVLQARGASVRVFLESQGSLARAANLSPDLRGAAADLLIDEEVYDSGVDVSKPIQADWNYASTATSTPQTFTWSVIGLLVVRLVWELFYGQLTSIANEKVIASHPSSGTRVPWFWQRISTVWALLLCFNILGFRLLWNQPAGAAIVTGSLIGSLVLLPFAVRTVVGRGRERGVRHFGWTPAVAVGSVGAVLGVLFAPYPATDPSRSNRRWAFWWLPSIVLFIVTIVLLALVATTHLPYLRAGAASAVVLLGSLLLPVPPFDGSRIRKRWFNWAISAALAAVTLVFVLQWI